MEKIKIKFSPELDAFLSEKEAKTAAINAINNSRKNYISSHAAINGGIVHLDDLMAAFTWTKTPQGHEYWEALYDEFSARK